LTQSSEPGYGCLDSTRMLQRQRYRSQQWMHWVGLVLCFTSLGCRRSPSRDGAALNPPAPQVQAPLVAMSCEDANRFPQSVPKNDVRFLNCGEKAHGVGEAFELGEPALIEPSGPPPTAAGVYAPGHCDHRGGAIMDFNVFYAPEHYAAAVECSRQRCEAKDARGCDDLGALQWRDVLPSVQKDEARAIAAFGDGCKLGLARSCLSLATIFERRSDVTKAMLNYRAACDASPPAIEACAELGEQLTTQGHSADAKPYLLRACRGETSLATAFAAQRQGCGLLAVAAAERGDVESQREYLRLECAYGTASPSACAELGQLLFATGDKRRAEAYLRRACESVTQAKSMFPAACQLLTRIELGRK
jgi:hypothetical protein